MTARTALTLGSTVKRSPQLVDADVDGEVVALHIDKGVCYGLNKVGSHIWKLAAEPISVSAICGTLIQTYDVSAETCETQVLRLLEGLRTEGLIDVVESRDSRE
jgi:hypothetical protein